MCGRFVSTSDPDGIVRFFTVDDRQADDLPPSWNVAPTDDVYAIAEHDRRRVLVTLRWGLVPRWSTDRRAAARMINARIETVADKPAFRTAFARRRCLIPADGFYEWVALPGGTKQPYFIHHADDAPLALAGLWETWRDPAQPTAPVLRSCTILTTAADETMAALHHRMPVVLDPDRWTAWLDRDLTDTREAVALLDGVDARSLVHHPVGTEVGNVRSNGPDLIRPVTLGAPDALRPSAPPANPA
jgi:putative SOS response-associated peptidase YedK